MKLDELDKKLLRELQKNGKASNAELADSVNLSPSACHRRVAELEKSGIIANYVALLDPPKVDLRTVIFVEITLIGQSQEIFEKFEAAVQNLPGLLECHLMAGTADYKLKIIARDAEDFAYMHRHYLSRLPGVSNMQSSFALKTVFRTTALPLE